MDARGPKPGPTPRDPGRRRFYVQPPLAELVKVRGLKSSFHNNAIQSWKVDADGSVHNIHV
jgi:hypothetical protein